MNRTGALQLAHNPTRTFSVVHTTAATLVPMQALGPHRRGAKLSFSSLMARMRADADITITAYTVPSYGYQPNVQTCKREHT